MTTLVQPSPLLLLGGAGTMLVGVIPVFYWRRETGVSWKVFGLGGVVWLSTVVLKAALDIFVTPSVAGLVQGSGSVATALAYGLYTGLETGIFVVGFTWIWARRFKLFEASFEDAVGFGAGFACVEALSLGFRSFLGILEIVMNPGLLATLDPTLQKALSAQYALGPALIGAPVVERLASLFIDCFAIVMIFMAIRGVKGILPIAVAYASMADLVFPVLNVYVSNSSLVGSYILEAPYVLLGFLGLLGLMRSRWDPVFLEKPKGGKKPHAR